MHEQVQAGVGPREFLAPLFTEKDRGRHPLAQRRGGRAAADHDEPNTRQLSDRGQQVNPLLGGQPADVAGERLTSGGQLLAQRGTALRGTKTLEVHSAAPQPDPLEPVRAQLCQDGRRRRQGPVRRVVDPAQPAPGGRLPGSVPAVRAGVRGDVGLVHSDRGQPQVPGHRASGRAQEDRTGQVDQVGTVPGQGAPDRPGRQAETEARITRQGHRRYPFYRVGERASRLAPGRFRGDD